MDLRTRNVDLSQKMMSSFSRLAFEFWNRQRLPIYLQTEAAECGLACLAMVASYWGHKIDVPNMRRRFSVSMKGSTLRGLIAMSQGLGLKSRPVRAELDQLIQLSLPCVLHWDMNHFVVLRKLGRTEAVVHDPAVGERVLSLSEISKHYTGIALELVPGNEFSKTDQLQDVSLLRLMGQVVGLKRGLGQLLLLGLGLQLCLLLAPFFVQWVVDMAIVSADKDLISVLGIGFLLLVVVQAVFEAVRSWVTIALSTSLKFQWFGNAFAHLMKLPLTYFEKRHLGDVVSRFGSIHAIQQNLTTQFVEAIVDGLLVATTLLVMFFYDVQLALIAVGAVACYLLIKVANFKRLRDANAEQIAHTAKQQTHLLESARGIQSIRLFNRGEERRIGWMNILAEQFNADLRAQRLNVLNRFASTALFGICRIATIWLGAIAAVSGHLSVGALLAFISYQEQFTQRISSLIDKLFDFRMLRVHGERVADILMTEPEPTPAMVEFDMTRDSVSVELKDISFRYSDDEPYVLSDVNMTVSPGECVAITGASGSGKTTLLKILLGLLQPTSGEVLVGGVGLKRLGATNFRSILGTVMQDDQLFAGSLADNIAFFDAMPSQTRIEECATLAAVHEEIIRMPMGYNTLVGDIGSGLSGGQKQRILLARALYRLPKLVVLDEATSHLDIDNERAVNSAVKQLDITRILVAHRPETIATAERVIFLEAGKIVDPPPKSMSSAISHALHERPLAA